MTNRKIKRTMRFLEILMQCLFFITLNIILSFALLKYNVSEYSRCLMISVLVIASYIFRKYIDGFFTFYFMHALLFVVAIFYARSNSECFIYIVEVALLMIYSGHTKITAMKLSDEKIPMVGMALMVICYVLGLCIDNDTMIQSGLLILVLFTMTQIIYNNFDKINNVFIENRENADFPAKQLFRVNLDMLATSLIIVFMGMMAFYSGPYGNVFEIIGRFFHWIIGLILKLLFRKLPNHIEIETSSTDATKESVTALRESYYSVTHSGSSFDQLFYALLIMFAIFLSIFLIIKIVGDVKKFSKKKKLGSDVIEFVMPKKMNKSRVKILRGIKLNEESQLDHNLKLRKIYKKKVKKGIGHEKISPNTFPSDITKKGISEDPKDIKIVTDIYEKARYSDEKVNLEEIEIVKNIKKIEKV